MIPAPVPVIQKAYGLILGDGLQKPAFLFVTVDPHSFRKQRVAECKIRIVLAGVFFFNNHVGNKVQQQPAVLAKLF